MISWDRMCQPIDLRGFKFRNSTIMNDALLVKQAWIVLQNPETFVTSTLLTKYCKDEHFLDVTAKANSSWGSKSILVGRDIILKGVDMQIWSGNSTHFTSTSNVTMTVNQLIANASSWWDEG